MDLRISEGGNGLITPDNLPEIRKATGKVYQILTETMERYWNKKSLLYWTRMSSELYSKKVEAYKADNLFPYEFFDDMADKVLRWHMNDKFSGINDYEIKPMFQRMWQLHRKYLGVALTDDDVQTFMGESDAYALNFGNIARPHVVGMLLAIMHDLDKRNPSEGENTDEQTAEKSASQTI